MHDPERTGAYQPESPDSPEVDAASLPTHIGRYRVEKLLGKGGFGLVYLTHDPQLQRLVAIKVPHHKLVDRPEAAEAYLTEARTVANLDHPNIVPVHDVGSTEDYPCYVVSKYIDGIDLATRLKESRLSPHESVELVATVAEALHHAHKQGLVHRDIKPGNLLLDKTGKPFVADFGLALREQDVGRGPRYAGTPAYMSPEQARGEGHRVDGRSDIFSLGVVLYELLTGRRPFHADSRDELLEQISTQEVRPPRQWDDMIPKELERICLKALSKRASERYTTAKDMADDLRHILAEQTVNQQFAPVEKGSGSPAVMPALQPPSTSAGKGQLGVTSPITPSSDQQPFKIVPKGLRSFDAHDADFFLELLPGPRDRDGLPDSIRFWKARIEEKDADSTFSVGLIYGPSGCGKSSLVKAGLLPRLSDDMIAVYVEATAEETETRLLNGLRKRCLALPDNLNLKATLAALRRGQGIPVGKKVVIVLDQFEQWLHAKKEEQNTELVQALRQCDGERVQCVVMVRDDFWLSVSRFVRDLEVDLVPGRNIALVDLFDLDHARKVLAAFGRAFGKLHESSGETTKDQNGFLNQAVSGLSQEGKVICVRLALFAEMMKGKSWTPATLKEVGGTEGVGVAFLEETFSSPTANPKHRYHQKAARADLKVLLPETGSDIKGHMRSYAELLEASGYGSRPKDFDDLIRILDGEIRLITPTDPEGKEEGSSSSKAGEKYYQLTHDYLVHSLRDWLTRKQKETRHGRAELLLADRAAVWNARPEDRQLPSLVQWFQIRRLTAKKDWKPPQRKMMGKASRYHAVRGLIFVALVALLGFAGYEGNGRLQAHALRRSLLNANTNEVPGIVADMSSYRRWIDPLLRDAAVQAEANKDAPRQLHASLALLPVDAMQVEYLYGRLLDAEPNEVPVIRDALAPHKDELLDRLWVVAETPVKGKESQRLRLRAAAALAKYDPEGEKWKKANAQVVDDLVLENTVYLGQWSEAFRPVKNRLLLPLTDIFKGHQAERAAERSLATNLLADYAADEPKVLADLVMNADEKQFAIIFPLLENRGEQGVPVLIGEIDRKVPPDAKDEAKEKLAKRQANAAVALLRMKQPEKAWQVLKHSRDPRVRSYLIHRLYPLGADAGAVVERLKDEADVTIRRALLLSLGEFGELSPDYRKALLPKVQEMYRTEADPGLHAASEWLLRQWKETAWLKQTNDEWAKDKAQQDKASRAALAPKAKPQWYVNGQGQTMVVIPGPVTFVMGSPTTEGGRSKNETQHKRRIGRTFSLSAKSVTVEQYRKFDAGYSGIEQWARTPDSPVLGTSWFQAAAYCNWLSKEEGMPESEWCYEPLIPPLAMAVLSASSIGMMSGSPVGLGPLSAACGVYPGRIVGQYTGGMRLAANYLRRTGYRLPTEAEMEYATRAGAETSRYYGETEDLLGKYGWYVKNGKERAWPVGSLKPNDLGLFDVHGNVYTWCQERYDPYPKAEGDDVEKDTEGGLVVIGAVSRLCRGGSFGGQPSNLRSASRASNVPTARNSNDGFRPARTFVP